MNILHWFVGVALASGGNPGGTSIPLPNPLGLQSFSDLWTVIITAVYYISIPVTTAMALWGAFQILTAGGDSDKVKNGGKTILYAAVGFALVLIALGLTNVIKSLLA